MRQGAKKIRPQAGGRRKTTAPIDKEKVLVVIDGINSLEDLKWEMVAAIVGHAERSLRRIDDIYEAFWRRKDELTSAAAGYGGKNRRRRTRDEIENETISHLRNVIKGRDAELKKKDEIINSMRQAFVQLVYNGNKEGVDVERLWTTSIESVVGRKI